MFIINVYDYESKHFFIRRACTDDSSMIRVFDKLNKVKIGFHVNSISVIHLSCWLAELSKPSSYKFLRAQKHASFFSRKGSDHKTGSQ